MQEGGWGVGWLDGKNGTRMALRLALLALGKWDV